MKTMDVAWNGHAERMQRNTPAQMSVRMNGAARLTVCLLTASVLMLSTTLSAFAQTRSGQRTSLEARVSKLERQLSANTLFELLDRLEALQRDVQALRGDIEIQGHDIAELKRRQRELFVELDKVSTRVDRAPVANAAPPVPPANSDERPSGTSSSVPTAPRSPAPSGSGQAGRTAAPAPTPSPSGGPDPFAEQSAYSNAFNLLQDGRYEKSAMAFQSFLKKYPNGQYADNAQYWLGETFYVTRKFPRSLQEFNKLVERFPSSPKLPGARLKIGFIHQSMGDTEKAKEVLNDLVRRFPKSTPARLARDRLKQLDRR